MGAKCCENIINTRISVQDLLFTKYPYIAYVIICMVFPPFSADIFIGQKTWRKVVRAY